MIIIIGDFLSKHELPLIEHEGRRARERQREGLARRAEGESQRSGNFSLMINYMGNYMKIICLKEKYLAENVYICSGNNKQRRLWA